MARAISNLIRCWGSRAGSIPFLTEKQPYYPNAPAAPNEGGPHLVYIDVWEREVTSVEDPDLVENAVGVDTTSRLQTVWQVRVLSNVGANATCGDPDEQVPGWLDIIRPSAGRLTTKAIGVASPDDPCLIPPSGGYRGLENRLYRVEIHDAGKVGTATFKWSRDNASVATGISAIEGDKTLTVDRAVWDSVRRFSPGDWVEITDDWREFSRAPGEIRRIATVVDSSRAITLDAALTAGLFPVNGQNLTTPERHTRIKRWDQVGIVRDSDGNTYVDLDAAGGTGLIEVPAANTSLILEDGVEVTFTTVPNNGAFRSGDYWVFAARTADASVEELEAAPPRGVHHHYCRLGLVTFPDQVIDCRIFWPPSFGGDGESCDCTICVTAEQQNQGTFTIQQAVNQLLQTGGGTVCLGPGIFNLKEKPVLLSGAIGIRIRGQGAATIVIQPRANAAFIFTQTQWCTLDYLTIHSIASSTSAPALRLTNTVGTTLERLLIGPPAEGNGPLAGISLEAGFALQTKIRDNFIRAQIGISFAPEEENTALLLSGFYCEHNLLQCSKSGIDLGGTSLYGTDTVLSRNYIFDTGIAGISLTGFASPELEIVGNTITPSKGDGIVVGTGGVRINDNRLVNLGAGGEHGIRLIQGLIALALAPVVVRGNRIVGWNGNGLAIETAIVSAVIQDNVFNSIAGNGLIMLPGSAAGSLKVLANELINIAVADTPSEKSTEISAIYLRGVFEGAVSDNAISAVGTNSPLANVIAGIRVDSSVNVRVSDNTITNVAPATQFANPGIGVLVVGPIVNVEIADNLIKRQILPHDNDGSPWQAIRIAGLSGQQAAPSSFVALNADSPAGQVNSISTFAAAAAPANEQAGIVGNSLHGYGAKPLAEVLVTGSCRFSDNHCSEIDDKLQTEVALAADAIIAGNNRIESARSTRALDLTVGNKENFTVLGNIVGGLIKVNGADLDAPWKPLNRLGA